MGAGIVWQQEVRALSKKLAKMTTKATKHGFSKPIKNASRRAKVAARKLARKPASAADAPGAAPHLKGAHKHLPPGLALPEKSVKKQKQLARYARICEREALAASTSAAPAGGSDAVMR